MPCATFFRPRLTICTVRSANPFEAGWYGAEVRWRIPFAFKNASRSSLVKQVPLSVTNVSGMPNCATELCRRRVSLSPISDMAHCHHGVCQVFHQGWPSRYEWNRFTPNTQASHSFSSWELGVVLLRWWQCTCSVYSIGLSVPSSIRWTSTAPIPYADASQARVSGRLASKWTRSLEDVNNSLDLRKAFSSSAVHCHWDSFLSKRYNGANTVETSGRNLQY